MAAYVVHAQVAGVRPQRADRRAAGYARRPVAGTQATAAPGAWTASAASADGPVAIDIAGRGLGAVIRERWTRAAEIWSQTTFYLFDPNSWR